MAETALKELNEQVKLVRQEAYAAGFATAMRVGRAFAEQPAPREPASAGSKRPRRVRSAVRASATRPHRLPLARPARRLTSSRRAKLLSRSARRPGVTA